MKNLFEPKSSHVISNMPGLAAIDDYSQSRVQVMTHSPVSYHSSELNGDTKVGKSP